MTNKRTLVGNKQQKYCKPQTCLSADFDIKKEHLNRINNNSAIFVTYTCAGHENEQ